MEEREGDMLIGRRAGAIVVCVAALAAATLLATPAGAATPHYKVLKKPCLEVQTYQQRGAPVGGCLPYGTTITIACTVGGDPVRGPFGATYIWDQVQYKGLPLYVADAWVSTGTMKPVAPFCGGKGRGDVVHRPGLGLYQMPTTDANRLTTVPVLSVVTIECTTKGPKFQGPWGASDVWDRVTYASQTGYLMDARVYTGTTKPVAPPCKT